MANVLVRVDMSGELIYFENHIVYQVRVNVLRSTDSWQAMIR